MKENWRLLAGYTKAQEIFSNLDTHVYRALSDGSNIAVIMKIKRRAASGTAKNNSIVNEPAIYRLLCHQGHHRNCTIT